MRFGEEVVCVDAGSQHGGNVPYRRIRFDGGGQNHEIGVDVKLFVFQKIGSLNLQNAVFVHDFADLAFYIVHAVLLDGLL